MDGVPDRFGLNQPIRALGQRDRPLSGAANGDARDIKVGRLLLDSPRIGNYQPGLGEQAHELKLAHGAYQVDARRPGQSLGKSEALQPLAGSRVDREDQGQVLGAFDQLTGQELKCFGSIDVDGPMQGPLKNRWMFLSVLRIENV